MAIIKKQDIKKMNENEIIEKIKELRILLIKEEVSKGKGGKIKIKEIKKTIARLLTNININRINRKSVVNK